MSERQEFVPRDAEHWRPAYLPPLPHQGPPWPIADYVPNVVSATSTPIPEAAALAEVMPAAPSSPLPYQEPSTPSTPAAELAVPGPSERAASREKGQRVELHGYVAGTPWFGTDRNGVPTCVFPLATHPEPDTTVTFRVRAKRERAQKLRGNLRRGDAVSIVGYLHREVFKRAEQETVSEIINLTALKKPSGGEKEDK